MLPVGRRSPRPRSASHLASGRSAERKARLYYLVRGYRILATNERVGRSEIDLIVRRGSELVFCEVKMRSRSDFGRSVEMVSREQEDRVRSAAARWLSARPRLAGLHVSFEIVGIDGRRIERIRDAF